MTKDVIVDEMHDRCLMSSARRLSRVLTAIYDEELRPLGLRPGQLVMLIVIAKAGLVRRIDIGRITDLDPSTLTRNLSLLLDDGWIEEVADSSDGRGNPVRITAKGRAIIRKAAAPWKKAQRRACKLLGQERAEALITLFGPTTQVPKA
jgi:DNA-binding MarR family transcriptional regulator